MKLCAALQILFELQGQIAREEIITLHAFPQRLKLRIFNHTVIIYGYLHIRD